MNEAMLSGGKYNNTIVSLVGKFLSMTSFQCCDGGIVELSGEHADIPEMIFNNNKMVVEVVGQVVSPTLVAVSGQNNMDGALAAFFAFPPTYMSCRPVNMMKNLLFCLVLLHAWQTWENCILLDSSHNNDVHFNFMLQLFVVRELSEDMDLDLHNRMLAVQHNPKFASYFKRTMASN